MKKRCAACDYVGDPITKQFDKGMTGPVCARCGSEDIFDDNPEERTEAERINKAHRDEHQRRDNSGCFDE